MEYGAQPPIYTPPIDETLPENWGTHSGGGGGSDNYNDLSNKPKLNNVTIEGTKTSAAYGLASVYAAEVLSTMPSNPTAKQTVMYVGESDATYTKGHVYRYSGTAWVEIYAPQEGAEVESIPLVDIDGLFS